MPNVHPFRRDKRGNVTIAFGLLLVMILLAAGLAIDLSREFNARTHIMAGLDAGALAGAKLRLDDDASDADVSQTAKAYFESYLANMKMSGTATSNFQAATDRTNWTGNDLEQAFQAIVSSL